VGNTRFVHLFATRRSELATQLSILRRKIAEDAALWVSWPKKSSGVATDITEDVIRAVALPLGFVDIKVCAVDQIWSGLKLMIRRENRKSNTRKKVDEIAKLVREAGGKNLEGPEICQEYSPGYYACFFEDPDGNKLEICCRESPIIAE